MPERGVSENVSPMSSDAELGPPGMSAADPFAPTNGAMGRPGTFFSERTQVPPGTDGPELPTVRFCLPHYHILSELGRGGMGVVYKAIQLGLNRLVALKMILSGGHASPEALARFRREAEAIARLQHPNIIQVYEIGEHEGRPFFSLEYVDGGSLAAHTQGCPQPALQAATLVETLARAMHVVHQHGIIHRDLKPANILLAIGDQPSALSPTHPSEQALNAARSLLTAIPKITDFGLAKQESSELTASNAAVGTPSYMSPEQAQGAKHITPLADVYSLGAILYELLTGRPPFRGATPLETIIQVVQDEPLPVRLLQPRVPHDLETICLKCLHKEPSRRYRDALALAEDLQAFREGRPIAARPVGRLERAWRWCRRNRLAAGLLAAVFLALVTAVVSLSVGLWLAEQHRAEIQRRSLQYREALDEQTTSVMEDLLSRQRVLTDEHRALLRRTLTRYEEFTRASGGDPEARAALADAFHRVAKIRERLNDAEEAEAAYRRAIALQAQLVVEQPLAPRIHRLARMRINLCRILVHRQKVGEAETILQAVLAAYVPGRGPPDEQREALEVHSLGQRVLFYVLEATGRSAEGEAALLACTEAYGGLLAQEPRSLVYRVAVLNVRMDLAAIQAKLGKLPAAEASLRALIPALETVLAERPEDVDLRSMLAATHSNLAEVSLLQRRPTVAEPALQASQRLYAELTAGYPANPEHRWHLAGAHFRHARLLRQQQRYHEAQTAAMTALKLQERLAAEYPDDLKYRSAVVGSRQLLATILDMLDHVPQAEQEFRAAIAGQEAMAAAHPALTALVVTQGGLYADFALFLLDHRQAKDALPWFDKAVATLTPILQREPNYLEARRNLLAAYRCRALTLTKLDRPTEVVRDWEQVLALEDKPRRDFRLHYAIALANAGRASTSLTAAAPVLAATDLNGEEHFLAACVYGLAATADPIRNDEFAARAIAQLQAAHRQKWFSTLHRRQQLRKEPALAALQTRPDFQQLLQDISPGQDQPQP